VRKILALVLGVLFILSLTAIAFAEDKTEITLGGKILVRGWNLSNIAQTADSGLAYLPTKADAQTFYSTNVNLMVDAKVTDNVRGFLEIETASGGNRNSGLYLWGDTNPNTGTGYDTKPNADLLYRQAWIQYTGAGLGVPAGIKVGHMLYSLGQEKFLNFKRFGSDGILVWIDPTKEAHIALSTWKLDEGSLNRFDDMDAYIADLGYMWDKDNTVGANYTYVRDDSSNVDFSNIGVNANGKISGLSYGAEVDLQFGEVKDGTEKTKFRGYGIFAKLGYMIDPVNVRASFAYGSGDTNDTDNKNKEFVTLEGPDYGYTARLIHYTQIYERVLKTAASGGGPTDNNANTGIANTTYYNLGIDVNPMQDLSLSLDGFYLTATKTAKGVDDYIGSEIDFAGTYKIAKNLSYIVQAGYFLSGDFYKDEFSIKDKDVLMVVHGLQLTF
jgi:hypothetical protein